MKFLTEALQFLDKEFPDQYNDREKSIMLLGSLEAIKEMSQTNLSNIEIEKNFAPVNEGKIAAFTQTFHNLEILLQKVVTDLDTLGVSSGIDFE